MLSQTVYGDVFDADVVGELFENLYPVLWFHELHFIKFPSKFMLSQLRNKIKVSVFAYSYIYRKLKKPNQIEYFIRIKKVEKTTFNKK